jgi:hypothetical protein
MVDGTSLTHISQWRTLATSERVLYPPVVKPTGVFGQFLVSKLHKYQATLVAVERHLFTAPKNSPCRSRRLAEMQEFG